MKKTIFLPALSLLMVAITGCGSDDNEATEDIDDADDGHVRGESDGYGYDQELESLKEQLMSVRRTQSKRHLRSKSKEELFTHI